MTIRRVDRGGELGDARAHRRRPRRSCSAMASPAAWSSASRRRSATSVRARSVARSSASSCSRARRRGPVPTRAAAQLRASNPAVHAVDSSARPAVASSTVSASRRFSASRRRASCSASDALGLARLVDRSRRAHRASARIGVGHPVGVLAPGRGERRPVPRASAHRSRRCGRRARATAARARRGAATSSAPTPVRRAAALRGDSAPTARASASPIAASSSACAIELAGALARALDGRSRVGERRVELRAA